MTNRSRIYLRWTLALCAVIVVCIAAPLSFDFLFRLAYKDFQSKFDNAVSELNRLEEKQHAK
ncbi:MAG: hypothetical protein BWY75_00591 [bacterium ADurb.Bin425]|nr:MAG: hypothetical protein BWY75_00591 [bacterium ADurb.Bin425]